MASTGEKAGEIKKTLFEDWLAAYEIQLHQMAASKRDPRTDLHPNVQRPERTKGAASDQRTSSTPARRDT